jgi:hypothetical protein
MIVAAAVCPCPPLLVPAVAAGAAPELAGVRAACGQALDALAAAAPDRLLVVGSGGRGAGDDTAVYPAGTAGSFREFGVPLSVVLGAPGQAPDTPGRTLPPALAVAAWLLHDTGWDAVPVEGYAPAGEPDPDACRTAGRRLAAAPRRTALLVMGDGSACRSLSAPGYLDPRAEGFDAAVARALAAADTAALAGLDATLATELQAAGRPAWQLLAGAAEDAGLHGELFYEGAPYGVGYFVAAWT